MVLVVLVVVLVMYVISSQLDFCVQIFQASQQNVGWIDSDERRETDIRNNSG